MGVIEERNDFEFKLKWLDQKPKEVRGIHGPRSHGGPRLRSTMTLPNTTPNRTPVSHSCIVTMSQAIGNVLVVLPF